MSAAGIQHMLQQALKDPQRLSGPLAYMGMFRGIVESVTDPERRGRVRVRIPGVYDGIPAAQLPWAERCFPDGGNAGYGNYSPLRPSTAPEKDDGDLVWVVFEGGDIQLPVVLGTWYAIPEGQSDLPSELQRPVAGQYRVHTQKTRHGHSVELIDEPGQHEIKIKTARGDIISLRESDGGRGIHIETSEGNRISLQDEQPGSAGTPVAAPYDSEPDTRYDGNEPLQRLPFAPAGSPNGTPQSLTPGTPQGFGVQGIHIETINGHKVSMRDVTNPGITVESVDGHKFEISDDADTLRLQTANNANAVTLSQSAGTITVVASSNVVLNAGNNVSIVAANSIGFSAPAISCNTPAFAVNADSVIFTSPDIEFITT